MRPRHIHLSRWTCAIGIAALVVGPVDASSPTAAADAWTTYRGDSARTGVATSAGPKDGPHILWQVETAGAIVSEPAVVDGSVYVGSDDGNLYALETVDGTERWRFAANDAVSSSPAVVDGVVYVGSADGNIYALDASSGAELWRSVGARAGASPAVVDGVVYSGSADGDLRALDAVTGKTLWSAPLGEEASRSPAVAEGLVVIGSADSVVHALDAASGEERWTFPVLSGVISTPVIVDGVVFDCAFEGDDNALYALDAATGRELWHFAPASQASVLPPIVHDGFVYAPSADGHLYALEASSGQERWRLETGDAVLASPTLADGIIYLLSFDRHLYAVEASTGTELWRIALDGGGEKGPAVAGGVAYIGTEFGTVYAVAGSGDSDTAGLGATMSPLPAAVSSAATPGAGVADGVGVDILVLPVTAAEDPGPALWEAAGPGDAIAGGPPVVDPAGNIWVPDSERGAFRIFSPTGEYLETWGTPGTGDGEFDFTRSDSSAFGDVAFDRDGTIYVADVGNHRIQMFDAQRRFLRAWGSKGEGDGQFLSPNNVSVGIHRVYVGDDLRGDVQQFGPTGWYIRTLDVPTNDGEALWYTGTDPQTGDVAVALDRTIARFGARGQLKWIIDPPFDQPLTVDFDDDGNLVANGMLGVNEFDPDSAVVIDASGRLVRRIAVPWVLATVTPDGNTLLLGDFETGRLQALVLRPPSPA